MKGEKSRGKEDILKVAQPVQAPEGPGSSSSLMSEAKSMGTRYWIKASIGLLFVIFFAAFVPNAYLQYKYSSVWQESPCKLCQDLNAQQAGICFSLNQNYSKVPQTHWITVHPIRELGQKAAWLQIPCDVCAGLEGGGLGSCLNKTFHPESTTKKINGSLNLSFIPEGDISS